MTCEAVRDTSASRTQDEYDVLLVIMTLCGPYPKSPSCGRIKISSTTAWGDIEKVEKTASATSSACTNRSGGKSTPAQLAVSVGPGNMAVTRTPLVFNSSRRFLVKPSRACLAMP